MMEEWFLEEFGPYGFTLTQTLYDPYTFTPCRQVIHPKGFKTRINLTPDLVDDFNGWSKFSSAGGQVWVKRRGGVPSREWVIEEMRNLIREELYRSYPEVFERKDFLPKQKLEQFKF